MESKNIEKTAIKRKVSQALRNLFPGRTSLVFTASLLSVGVGGLSMSLAGCTGSAQVATTPPPVPAPAPAEQAVAPAVGEKEATRKVTILSDVGFNTPESIYYDKKRDVYLVSNLNGGSHEKNGKGFISRITPGSGGTYETQAKFIDGEANGVTLNSPKGITVSDNTIYVADIDVVRMFDASTGAERGEIAFPDATLLNDLATGANNIVYVSDTGVTPEWKTNGSDAIYVIEDKKVKLLLADKEKLKDPNGLLAGAGGVWVTTGTGELYWVSDSGKQGELKKVSGGGNDGIALAPDARLLISSWQDQAVYLGKPDGSFGVEVSGLESPADIGFDCSRNQLLIPLFKRNEVVIHPL